MMAAQATPPGVPLARLLPGCSGALAQLQVTDLTLSSREVVPGGLFLAVAGARHHGLEFLADAQARGAAAVLWEPVEGVAAPAAPTVPALAVPDLSARAGELAHRFFDEPTAAMRVAAVTGTNGKTTVAWLVAGALESLGRPCTHVGTLGQGRPGALSPATLTTPDAVTLARRLAAGRDAGCADAVLEASSHALVQHRLGGVRVEVAAFTNLSQDHLDYHGDMAAYGETKARLFLQHPPRHAVINVDDPFGAALAQRLPAGVGVLRAGSAPEGAGGRALHGRVQPAAGPGLSLAWSLDGEGGVLDSPLAGRFNASNLLVALGILVAMGAAPADAAAALAHQPPPPGRMQAFGGAAGAPLVVVDYAHTPAGLEAALEALREQTAGRLVCVFGCGGERDRAKRPLMGEVAARLADEVVLTSDNPRGEDPAAIIADIRRGMRGAARIGCVPDRAEAIRTAVLAAAAGDTVLIAGKGHESVQVGAEGPRPFSDAQTVRAALGERP